MTRPHVEPPAALAGLPASRLGTLTPALRRLAVLQGRWPPEPPGLLRRLDPAVDEVPGGLERGRDLADAMADEGVDLLVLDSDREPTTALAALAALLGWEPVAAVGTGGGPGWAVQVSDVRRLLPVARSLAGDAEGLLDALGDPSLALLAGVLERAGQRRTPVLLGSGAPVAAALLLADRLAPGAAAWTLAGCSAAAPAAQRALQLFELTPVLDLRLPGAGGAFLAERVLLGALQLLSDA